MMSNVTTGGALIDRTDGTKGANAVICAKCHDLENFNYNSWAVEGANTAHDSHHQDVTGGVAQCVSCHIAIPHGWKRPRLLVDTAVDSYPYVSNDEMGNSGGSIAGGAATPGVGMLSLSAINNHPVGGTGQEPYSNGSSGSNVGAVTSTTTYTSFNPDGSVAATGLTYNPGHVGLAYWNEAQCAACNDHNSSGGVDTATGPRIK
jgi:hypothetical protein